MHILRHIKAPFWIVFYVTSRYFYQLFCLSCLAYFLAKVEPCMETADLYAYLRLAIAKEEVTSSSVQDYEIRSVVKPGKI